MIWMKNQRWRDSSVFHQPFFECWTDSASFFSCFSSSFACSNAFSRFSAVRTFSETETTMLQHEKRFVVKSMQKKKPEAGLRIFSVRLIKWQVFYENRKKTMSRNVWIFFYWKSGRRTNGMGKEAGTRNKKEVMENHCLLKTHAKWL